MLGHWPRFELHGGTGLCDAIITIWLADAYIELPSRPALVCDESLMRVEPLLMFFRNRGFEIPELAELLKVYVTH